MSKEPEAIPEDVHRLAVDLALRRMSMHFNDTAALASVIQEGIMADRAPRPVEAGAVKGFNAGLDRAAIYCEQRGIGTADYYRCDMQMMADTIRGLKRSALAPAIPEEKAE